MLLIIMILSTFLGSAQQNDKEGSEDYDLLGRMPDYFISNYWEYQFDDHDFIISKGQKQVLEGKKIIIRFEHQKANNRDLIKPSYLQILRNYSYAIKKAGGEILYEHKGANIGSYFLKTSKGKEVWVEVKTAPDMGRRYTLTIIEIEPMIQDIVIEADLIKEKIQLHGKIAVYGIYFDVGKSIIKTESSESLEQIAIFLKDNPKINCWVVGHTDSDGSFETNNTLSLSRAEAVVAYLILNYNISSDRLTAQGVGSLTPVTTNETDEGKKLNRRVELVKK